MKIGIIGAGNIGANAAKLFVKAGHEVAIANSRGAETLTDLANEIGAQALDLEDAARFGEIVLIAVHSANTRRFPPKFFRIKSSLTRAIIIQTATGNSPILTTVKRLRAN